MNTNMNNTYLRLSFEEREEISRGIWANEKIILILSF